MLDKPTISINPGIVAEHTEKVTFQCDTKDVNATIHWVFSSRPLVEHGRAHLSSDRRKLTISPVLREDAGSYQCEVWDAQGSQSSNPTYLVVNCESLSVPPKPLADTHFLRVFAQSRSFEPHPNADLFTLEPQVRDGWIAPLGFYQKHPT